MAKHELHNQAIDMRKEGASYSQIKAKLGISKSILSGWLKPYPLSPERLKRLGKIRNGRLSVYEKQKPRRGVRVFTW